MAQKANVTVNRNLVQQREYKEEKLNFREQYLEGCTKSETPHLYVAFRSIVST